MTPKEKAMELVEEFEVPTRAWNTITQDWQNCKESSKQCALICVELEAQAKIDFILENGENFSDYQHLVFGEKIAKELTEVKQEIQKL